MGNLSNFSLDKAVRSILRPILAKKGIVIGLLGLGLLAHTALMTLGKVDTQYDQKYYDKLKEEAIITSFDEEIIGQIRQLDSYEASIESKFEDNRNNPFIDE